MKSFLSILFAFLVFFSCSNQNVQVVKKANSIPSNFKTAYFAAGCFWCVEAVYESVKGVDEAISGYAGGIVKNPTYEQICTGRLRHAESVKVIYDPTVVRFSTLVDVFFNSHNPATLNQQGPDKGPQYRSIAFYQTIEEKEIIETKIAQLKTAGIYSKITTEVKMLDVFYEAEDYHQNYERNHPDNGYVQSVSVPRLESFKQKMPEVLK